MIGSSLSVALLLAAAPPSHPAAASAATAPEREAARALAAAAAGEPGIAEVQRAAARTAERAVPEAEGFAGRTRLAALLPRLTAELRGEERNHRIVGLQSSGEVDYARLTPARAIVLRATWDLGALVASRGELSAATAAAERFRRRGEAVKRATALYYERRQAQLELLLAPPADALSLAELALRIDRLTAELDALTGGRLSEGWR